jgi:hypothetical protein
MASLSNRLKDTIIAYLQNSFAWEVRRIYQKSCCVFSPQAYSINEQYAGILTQSSSEMGFVLIFVTTLLDDVIP